MSQENTPPRLVVPENKEKHTSSASAEHATTINPYVCRTGRDNGPVNKLPEHYISRISHKTGNHNMDFIRKCYDEDYPIVNPGATTDFDRRGMPNGHDRFGNPTWSGGKIPEGVKMENMTATMLDPPPSQSKTPYDDLDAATTPASLSTQNNPTDASFNGDACAWERSHMV